MTTQKKEGSTSPGSAKPGLKIVPGRKLGDWIESFQTFTKDIPSPEIFRKWTAIATVAGTLQRRVWIKTAQNTLYPNLYVLLVSPPGVGKSQAIARAQELWLSNNALHVAPNSVTKAALLDCLENSMTKAIRPDKTFQVFHALNVAASEFGVLVPSHDLEFLNTLNDIFDNPSKFRENRRHRSKQLDIDYPMLNILGGTQPAYLASLLPEEAWGMGFTSRLLMVYSATQVDTPLFAHEDSVFAAQEDAAQVKLKKALEADIERMTTLYGAVQWEPEARSMMESWARQGLPPIPTHSRLQHYNARRILHALKLCAISSVSRSDDLCVTVEDVNRGRDWLLEAEDRMPDIFRDMAGKSDKAIIDDLHSYMWQVWAASRNAEGVGKPIHEGRLWQFLGAKVPSEKIPRVLDLCLRSGLIKEVSPKMYLPTAKDSLPGVE